MKLRALSIDSTGFVWLGWIRRARNVQVQVIGTEACIGACFLGRALREHGQVERAVFSCGRFVLPS